MGYEATKLMVSGRVSRHNSPRDNVDNELWRDFCMRVEAIADEDRYDGVVQWVSCDKFEGYPEYEL